MPLPAILAAAGQVAPYALPFLPKLIDSIFGQGDERTGFERNIENKLQGIINQGGVGLDPQQINSRYRQMMEQLAPMFRAQTEGLNRNAAGRGIWNSGVALEQGQQLGQSQMGQMQNMLQNLTQWNEEQKLNTLMQALGMGTNVAGRSGDIRRGMKAGNQGSYMDMFGQLASMLAEKDFFNFDKPLTVTGEKKVVNDQQWFG